MIMTGHFNKGYTTLKQETLARIPNTSLQMLRYAINYPITKNKRLQDG